MPASPTRCAIPRCRLSLSKTFGGADTTHAPPLAGRPSALNGGAESQGTPYASRSWAVDNRGGTIPASPRTTNQTERDISCPDVSHSSEDDTLVGFLLPMTPGTSTGGIERSDTRAREGDRASDHGVRGGTVPRVLPHPVSTRGAIVGSRIAVGG